MLATPFAANQTVALSRFASGDWSSRVLKARSCVNFSERTHKREYDEYRMTRRISKDRGWVEIKNVAVCIKREQMLESIIAVSSDTDQPETRRKIQRWQLLQDTPRHDRCSKH